MCYSRLIHLAIHVHNHLVEQASRTPLLVISHKDWGITYFGEHLSCSRLTMDDLLIATFYHGMQRCWEGSFWCLNAMFAACRIVPRLFIPSTNLYVVLTLLSIPVMIISYATEVDFLGYCPFICHMSSFLRYLVLGLLVTWYLVV
jgi:hypothetical protein